MRKNKSQEKIMEDLIAIRRHLHQHPELSKQESKTQEFVLGLLGKLNVDSVEKVANTGIVVFFKGKAEGKNLLFRGDMDALPIQEFNDFEYRSSSENVSHKCGHDGHTTIMYGLAKQYAIERPEKGDVCIVFQPAEEIGWGAVEIVKTGLLDKHSIDNVVSLHNVPGYVLHDIVCREGSFTPAVTTLIASFIGYTSHAAEPWNGRNPAAAMSKYMLEALKYNEEQKKTHEFVTITPVYTEMGALAYGTSAGEGSVHLTIRADSTEKLERILAAIQEQGFAIAKGEGLQIKFKEEERFESNKNAQDVVALIKASANHLGLNYVEKDEPFRWGEDFGIYTQKVEGAMFGIGSGLDCKPLHHPAYDFPDEIITTAINMFITLQKEAQKK
ncbi:MAG: amidohydrolase [Flavipsychrobacter sp.]